MKTVAMQHFAGESASRVSLFFAFHLLLSVLPKEFFQGPSLYSHHYSSSHRDCLARSNSEKDLSADFLMRILKITHEIVYES